MKLHVEQCSAISISVLQSKIRDMINVNYPESDEQTIFQHTEEELNKFTVNNQKFEYTYIKNVLGGYRWFFLCGKCKDRVQKLFLPPLIYTGYEYKYYCKNCHKLQNESVSKSHSPIFKRVVQPLKKLHKIEAQLERGHLTQTKIEELLNEYDSIENQMKESLEYRRYVFKKRRGFQLF
jgi:hypothetical protein